MQFHHPIHKFEDNTIYFLTARIYGGHPIIKTDEKKQLLLDSLKAGFRTAGINPLGFHRSNSLKAGFRDAEDSLKAGFRDDEHSLKAGFQRDRNSAFRLIAWVILDDHYHIEFEAGDSKMLSKIINQIHGRLSYLFNKMDGRQGRKIFQNYWDTCIREEKDLWTRFNYIHHNPVKHGYCRRMEDYTFSSFRSYLNEKGDEWLDDCFSQYPVVDFMLKEED